MNSCKSKDDLREYEKFNVVHKMLNDEIEKYNVKVECKNINILYNTHQVQYNKKIPSMNFGGDLKSVA